MNDATKTELEAATFRRFVKHLQNNTDVQNIDLMILADFCRNCLSKWYLEAAKEREIPLGDAEARELIYGMPYSEWKKEYQMKATPEQLEKLQARQQAKEAKKQSDDV